MPFFRLEQLRSHEFMTLSRKLGMVKRAGVWISFTEKKFIQVLALDSDICVGWDKFRSQDVNSKAFEI